MKLRSVIALGAISLVVAACDNSGGMAPGAVSEGEARALEEAAEMLDERRLPDGVTPDLDAPVEPEAAPEGNQETETQE